MGAKLVRELWESLGIRSVNDLQRAAIAGRIRNLPHFGEKSEHRILRGITLFEDAAGRRSLGEVLEIARRIEAALAALPGVVHAVVAGSIRRHRAMIGDVDILVASTDPERVTRAFATLPEVRVVTAEGPTKTLVRLAAGIDADLRVLSPESFGAALIYFTGSRAHNVALRKIALKRGLKLNEYGLFRGPGSWGPGQRKVSTPRLGFPGFRPRFGRTRERSRSHNGERASDPQAHRNPRRPPRSHEVERWRRFRR